MESAADKIKREKQREKEVLAEITSLSDFLKEELPPNKWVIDGLIPEGMTIISSAPGQFKTYLLLALAKQISNGELGFGHFGLQKRNILFVNEEMGKRAMQDRMKSIVGEFGEFYMTNLAGLKLDDFSTLLRYCQEKEITIVFFDSLTRIHRLKENDADDVKKIFENVLLLLRDGISVIMTHHHRKAPMFGSKNGSDEMRGSTDILAQLDCHIAIDQVAIDKSYIVLKQLKIRIAENLPDFRINIVKKDDKISFVYKGNFSKADEVSIRVAQNSEVILKIIEENPGITKDDILKIVGGKVSIMAVKATLLDLEKKNVIFCKSLKPKTYYIQDGITTLI